jgi:hypothetical protein
MGPVTTLWPRSNYLLNSEIFVLSTPDAQKAKHYTTRILRLALPLSICPCYLFNTFVEFQQYYQCEITFAIRTEI